MTLLGAHFIIAYATLLCLGWLVVTRYQTNIRPLEARIGQSVPLWAYVLSIILQSLFWELTIVYYVYAIIKALGSK